MINGKLGDVQLGFRLASFHLLTRAKLRPGAHGAMVLPFEHAGEPFPVALTVDTRAGAFPRLELAHPARTRTGQAMKYWVALVTTRPHFGGVRWWFISPRTNARAAKLFLPLGGDIFANRRCYELGYQSGRESPADHMARKARKLNWLLAATARRIPE